MPGLGRATRGDILSGLRRFVSGRKNPGNVVVGGRKNPGNVVAATLAPTSTSSITKGPIGSKSKIRGGKIGRNRVDSGSNSSAGSSGADSEASSSDIDLSLSNNDDITSIDDKNKGKAKDKGKGYPPVLPRHPRPFGMHHLFSGWGYLSPPSTSQPSTPAASTPPSTTPASTAATTPSVSSYLSSTRHVAEALRARRFDNTGTKANA